MRALLVRALFDGASIEWVLILCLFVLLHHHTCQTEWLSGLITHCLIQDGLLIKLDASCLLVEECFTIFAKSDPYYNKLLDCFLQLLAESLIIHTE